MEVLNRRADERGRPGRPIGAFLLGTVFLGGCVATSGLLVLEHFGAAWLPGCGPGGACGKAAASIYGKIPGVEWPVSFVGFAYFAGLLVTWIQRRGRVAFPEIAIAALGVCVSAAFLVVVLLEQLFCSYCIATHVLNIAFFATAAAARGAAPSTRFGGAVTLATLFLMCSAALGVANAGVRRAALASSEQQRTSATEQIIARSAQPQPAPEGIGESVETPGASAANDPALAAISRPFTGRWRTGPEPSPIRIVMFTDYQCPDCRIFEREVREIIANREDVSLSIKHFPFCQQCNPHVPNLHGNACWAARAAEAAGMLYGNEGFWKVHHWLFDRQGRFESNQELNDGLRSLGLDPTGFTQKMSGPDTLDRVKTDIAEGMALGLERTPMIFVNGVELKGWNAPRALTRTVEQVAATNPPPRTADADNPPPALTKFVAQWREQPVRSLPNLPEGHRFGAPGGKPEIVLWGDYQEPFTIEADRTIRRFIAQRGGSYRYLHYPFDPACNPALRVKEARFPQACLAARAAEAAAALGGAPARHAMHEWLIDHSKDLTAAKIAAAAETMGLDAAAFQARMADPAIAARVAEDANASAVIGVKSIPTLFINGKFVTRVKFGDTPVLETILDAAAAE